MPGGRRSSFMRSAIASIVVAMLAVAAACADHGALLDTAPSSRPLPLFHIGLLRHGAAQFFYGLTVMTCAGDKAYWTFGARGAKAPPDTVTYGTPPTGYVTVIGPLPLDPGCYRVLITGGASTRFDVARDGHITARDSALVTTSPPPPQPSH